MSHERGDKESIKQGLKDKVSRKKFLRSTPKGWASSQNTPFYYGTGQLRNLVALFVGATEKKRVKLILVPCEKGGGVSLAAG